MSELWTSDLDYRHWAMGFGRSTLDSQESSIRSCQLPVVNRESKLWTMDFGLSTVDFGLWTIDFGLNGVTAAIMETKVNPAENVALQG